MSELSDVLEKSEITFPRAIDLGEVKRLMRFLAEKMPAHIGYSHPKPHESGNNPKFEGAIRRDGNLSTAFFKLEKVCSHNGSGKYGSLRFHTIPGYILGDDPKEVEIWNDSRALIEAYFSQRNSSSELRTN